MKILTDNEKKVFDLGEVDFGDGCDSMTVKFINASVWHTVTANVYCDDSIIGVCMFISVRTDDVNETVCEIQHTCGKHHVKLVTNVAMKEIRSVDFSDGQKFKKSDYIPTDERKLEDLCTSTWEATDMLGRKVASVEDVKAAHKDKKVGIFYWSWREAHKDRRAINLTKTLKEHPGAEFNEKHEVWGDGNIQCHWNEPYYGFYLNSDPYVIRKHAIMLSDAGVDFIVFDCTNGAMLWQDAYEPILEGFHQARELGIKTPQVAFMLNFAPFPSSTDMLRALYQTLYRPGRYSDLWFMIDNKPMIMAYPEAIPQEGVCESDTKMLDEMRNFFSFRPGQPGYGCGPGRKDHWGWLETFPQHKYIEREDGSCEMVTVGVGQNARDGRICTYFNDVGTYGRSYTHEYGHLLLDEESYKYGYNVQEQWDRAIDLDPDIVFITGWNEWQMGRCREHWILDPDSPQIAFVDQYDREHSRDIEPDIDGYLDTYYLQMIHNIRRFKGATQREKTSEKKTIKISGGKRQWNDVTPTYKNSRGSSINRDWDGYLGLHYVNNTSRNNIVLSKVARDDNNVYFYVKCAEDITAPCKENWMTLYLDTDRNKETGWEGYDIVVNRLPAKPGRVSVEAYLPTAVEGSYTWEKIGEAKMHRDGTDMTIELPRNLVGLNDKLDFEFKWSDNMQASEIMDFYANGDTAPIGRFNYLYKE